MLSSVLNSDRAVEVNVEIMRAFVRLREWLLTNKTLARRLNDLEKKYDHQFKVDFKNLKTGFLVTFWRPNTKPHLTTLVVSKSG